MISYIVKCIVIGYEHTQFLIIPYWKNLENSQNHQKLPKLYPIS